MSAPNYAGAAEFAPQVYATISTVFGNKAGAEPNEPFDAWAQRMQDAELLGLWTRDQLKNARTYKEAVEFAEQGGIVLDPETGLSPFRGEGSDVSDGPSHDHSIPVAERLAQYKARPLTGTVVT